MVQENCLDKDCIIVVGPTACGKSDYAIELAKKYNGEIINADSQQIYKDLCIGTAKPTIEEMQNIPHHLFDFVDTNKEFSVAEYKPLCEKCISEIKSRGKMPIIVGGTGFYVQSILYDYSYGNAAKDSSVRDKYQKLLEKYGNEYLYNLLKNIDETRANSLHPNDTKRVIRALEIAESGNLPSMVTKSKSKLNAYVIFLNMDRDKLYSRINERVDKMIDLGLENEVKSILNSGATFENQCMKAIGYKEWKPYFAGKATLEDTIELIKKNTRNYAKRQITWFKNSMPCDEIVCK